MDNSQQKPLDNVISFKDNKSKAYERLVIKKIAESLESGKIYRSRKFLKAYFISKDSIIEENLKKHLPGSQFQEGKFMLLDRGTKNTPPSLVFWGKLPDTNILGIFYIFLKDIPLDTKFEEI